jgi:alkylation response protein AidB-like acyl-CoA dehydrogenase
MTDVADAPVADDEVIVELRSWLEDNWDPDLTVAQWWERLGLAGWSAPTLATDAFGRGVARSVGVQVQNEIAEFGALGAPGGLGLLLAAPTIAEHGSKEQIDTYVRDIVTGQRAWCQLFSEPGAGSDLVGLTCRAVQDGDEWIVTVQKVWTSLARPPTSACSSPGRRPTSPSTRASPTSPSTCTSRGSRSVR